VLHTPFTAACRLPASDGCQVQADEYRWQMRQVAAAGVIPANISPLRSGDGASLGVPDVPRLPCPAPANQAPWHIDTNAPAEGAWLQTAPDAVSQQYQSGEQRHGEAVTCCRPRPRCHCGFGRAHTPGCIQPRWAPSTPSPLQSAHCCRPAHVHSSDQFVAAASPRALSTNGLSVCTDRKDVLQYWF
jgi:hypothetical protein